ncbi:unnamed protein product [Protopolystoma xenopodis]|uniref:Ig-like domain-containing protein n=1 Tax=Protopolystoma xenopodis TaxID=117903 RepID=A0A448WFT2_9PLAT|nr:unnamed protein product [Protopolystoma xenopodis]
MEADVEFRQNLIDTKGIELKHKELECKVINPKNYPVIWLKDDSPIVFDDRVQTKEVEGTLLLIFKELHMDDAGVYTCVIGKHSTKGTLEVTECDKPPSVDQAKFVNLVTLKKGACFESALPFKGKQSNPTTAASSEGSLYLLVKSMARMEWPKSMSKFSFAVYNWYSPVL